MSLKALGRREAGRAEPFLVCRAHGVEPRRRNAVAPKWASKQTAGRDIDVRGSLGNRDAQSGQSAKLRKYPGFLDAVDDWAAGGGRTHGAPIRAQNGSSLSIMVY